MGKKEKSDQLADMLSILCTSAASHIYIDYLRNFVKRHPEFKQQVINSLELLILEFKHTK